MDKFIVDFFVTGEKGYKLGQKKFRSYATCKAAIEKAFTFSLPSVDEMTCSVVFETTYRGKCTLNFTKTNYTTQLTLMQNLISAPVYTLEQVLA